MSWIAPLQYGVSNAAMHFRRRPGSLIASTLVVALALALPLFAYVLLASVLPVTGRLATDAEISVFLSSTATCADADALGSALRSLPAVADLRFIPREEALARVATQAAGHDLLAALNRNPLPDSWIIRVVSGGNGVVERNATMPIVEVLTARIRQLPNVDTVQIDSDWIARVDALLRLGRFLLAAIGLALATAVVAVIFNTIRLQAWAYREEVELMRLMGATESFLRRPFVYQGLVLGFAGGCIALAIVMGTLIPLNDAVGVFSHTYAADFRFSGPSYEEMVGFLGIAAVLGWIGAQLCFFRHASTLDA